MPTRERHVLLNLDLSTTNPIPISAVRARIPEEAHLRTYCMTEYGAQQLPFGSRTSGWHLWARPFEAMLRRARAECEDGVTPVRYHLASRGALPMAVYAGLCLSGAASVTVHNPRRRTSLLDSFPLEQPEGPQPAFFAVDHMEKRGDTRGPIAVCVGMGQAFSDDSIAEFLRSRGSHCAAVAYLNTPADDQLVLDERNAPGAIWQINRRLLDLRRLYEHSRGLAVFCACPVSLALTVGWAINPRIHGPVWIPNYESGVYRPALHFPMEARRRSKPQILLLSAAPQNEGSIDLQVQHRAVEDALAKVSSRYDPILVAGMRGSDLAEKLREHSPDIVHILAHGTDRGGLYVVTNDAQIQSVEIIQRELIAALRHGDPPPRLVLMHVCSAGITAEKLAADYDMTIGATGLLWQDTAEAFSAAFYGALADGLSVREAFDRTKLILGMKQQRGIEDVHAYFCPTGDQGAWVPFPA